MEFYSTVLLVAVVANGVSVAALVARLHWRYSDLLTSITRVAAGIGLALAISAVASHIIYGHTPGTDRGMSALEFVLNHSAPFVSAAVCGVLLAAVRSRVS